MNLFGDYDTYSEIIPVIWAMKIFGISTICLKGDVGHREIKTFQLSYVYCLASISLHILVLFLFIHVSITADILLPSFQFKISVYGGTVLCVFVIIIRCLVLIRKLDISIIYKKITEFDTKILVQLTHHYRICFFISIFLMSICSVSFMIIEYVSYRHMFKYANLLLTFVKILNFWPLITVDVLYLIVILTLWKRFKIFHLKIRNCMMPVQNNTINLTILRNFDLKPVTIIQLRKLYESLFLICEQANSSFSVSILISVTCKFLLIICNLYNFISLTLRSKTVVDATEIDIPSITVFCISSIILFLITWFCHTATSEVRDT
ncbi:hypothetical protein L9F63_022118, partial [Diploptera punctata]